ncbi:hypothetical protein GGS20DRAFT_597223 [Poronia punctata]|nr:hypothetical protein GGS20DRAFT_597223 [Poronia punctata]
MPGEIYWPVRRFPQTVNPMDLFLQPMTPQMPEEQSSSHHQPGDESSQDFESGEENRDEDFSEEEDDYGSSYLPSTETSSGQHDRQGETQDDIDENGNRPGMFPPPRRHPALNLSRGNEDRLAESVDFCSPAMIQSLRDFIKLNHTPEWHLTPDVIFTLHQHMVADYLFYNSMWQGYFSINRSSIMEFHAPVAWQQDLRLSKRTDRRVLYTKDERMSNGRKTIGWVRHQDGRFCIRQNREHDVSVFFPNAVDLAKLIQGQSKGGPLIEDYAVAILPDLVDLTPAAKVRNQIQWDRWQAYRHSVELSQITRPIGIEQWRRIEEWRRKAAESIAEMTKALAPAERANASAPGASSTSIPAGAFNAVAGATGADALTLAGAAQRAVPQSSNVDDRMDMRWDHFNPSYNYDSGDSWPNSLPGCSTSSEGGLP